MQSLRKFFWRSSFFPRKISFSREGKVFVLISLGLGFAAINTGNNLVYLVFSLSLAMIVLSGLLSEWNLRKLRPHFSPLVRAEATKPCFVEIGVENDRKRLPAFSVQVRLLFEEDEVDVLPMRALEVRPCEKANGSCILKFPRRGVFNIYGVAVTTDFPFSFFEKSVVFPTEAEVLVHPRIKDEAHLPSLYLANGEEGGTVGKSGHGTEIFGVREFRDGDNPRHKSYKRILPGGRELVKEFEQEAKKAVFVMVFDIYDEKLLNKDDLEKALENAASFCVSLLRQGFHVGLKTVSGRVEVREGRGESQMWQILDSLSILDFLRVPSNQVEAVFEGKSHLAQYEGLAFLVHPRFGVLRV